MAKRKIIVAGYLVGGPLGGLAWHHLQYVIGMHRLGYEVLFVEDSNDYASCYNPLTNTVSEDPSFGLSFIEELFSAFDLKNRWAYFHAHTNEWYGQSRSFVDRFIAEADTLLNLSGLNPLRDNLQNIPLRAFIDTDPAFTQIGHLTDPSKFQLAKMHTHFFSFGENFGKHGCTIPDDGFEWKATRQPVVMDVWPSSPINKDASWTTVMQWDSYKVKEFNGRCYGMKSSSFDDYLHLPRTLSNEKLELAIGSDNAPKGSLLEAGWFIANPLHIALTPRDYQHYIQQSKGEWSVAKHGYVVSNSGWFSERSAAYLASGKPVVVQDTGFSDFLTTGKGLFSFSSFEEAVECIKKVDAEYSYHCHQATQIAQEYFAADKVLDKMLSEII